MKKTRTIVLLVLICTIALTLFGCGASVDGMKSGWEQANSRSSDGSFPPEKGSKGESNLNIGQTDPSRKIAYTVSYYLETLAFDQAQKALQELCARLGGYVQSSNVEGNSISARYVQAREARYVLRIPAERLNDFFAEIGSVGNILSESLSSEDLTLQFVDTEARLTALQAQRDRIIRLLEQADDLQYVLKIEQELSDINYEIELSTNSLNKLASLVNYATVSVSLFEVYQYTDQRGVPVGFGARLSATFRDSVHRVWYGFQDFGVFFLGNIIEIMLVLALISLGVFLFFLVRRRLGLWDNAKQNNRPGDPDSRR